MLKKEIILIWNLQSCVDFWYYWIYFYKFFNIFTNFVCKARASDYLEVSLLCRKWQLYLKFGVWQTEKCDGIIIGRAFVFGQKQIQFRLECFSIYGRRHGNWRQRYLLCFTIWYCLFPSWLKVIQYVFFYYYL